MTRTFPVAPSEVIAGIAWLGERIPYPAPKPGEDLSGYGPVYPGFDASGPAVRGDTFPMTWAANGEIYTSAGDC
ncbi:MAG: hypothetical protein IT330_13775, partial [Anaerolineae bacterium]|nr:hypothetical protein [Anaerolineae bacterium]